MVARLASSLALLAAALTLAPRAAHADDEWSAPHRGIRHLHRTDVGVDLHVVLVDLTNPELSVVSTRPEDRFITTSEFARRYDAVVALNANFYDRGSCGLAVGGGRLFEDSYEDGCTASLGFSVANEALAFDSSQIPRGPLPADWVSEVLTGKPWLMRNGRAETNWQRPQHLYRSNPRSAAGVNADRSTLVLLAADGRRPGVEGLNGFQIVEALREFDVTDAVNLDGGGSTALVLDGSVANHPSDRNERSVVTHLGVRLMPGARWYAGEIVARDTPSEAREGAETELHVDVRNTGRRAWRRGETAPSLELRDGATVLGATLATTVEPGATGRFTLRWSARGVGAHALSARVIAPDGATLATTSSRLAVAPAVRAVRPRESARVPIARAGIGFGVGAAKQSPSPLAWMALAVFASLVASLRARREPLRCEPDSSARS